MSNQLNIRRVKTRKRRSRAIELRGIIERSLYMVSEFKKDIQALADIQVPVYEPRMFTEKPEYLGRGWG
ncbi:MAG: hypothetical protein C4586_08410 [Anaerolineaceae bacterium]|nr:MAG: hypothetical protein C4586_08410 [Anaerolineaceae bacterium]